MVGGGLSQYIRCGNDPSPVRPHGPGKRGGSLEAAPCFFHIKRDTAVKATGEDFEKNTQRPPEPSSDAGSRDRGRRNGTSGTVELN
jgi:hypothetical protein